MITIRSGIFVKNGRILSAYRSSLEREVPLIFEFDTAHNWEIKKVKRN